MQAERSYRGWIVTFTVAGVVTYFVLAVERDFRLTNQTAKSQTNDQAAQRNGIWVGSDPNLALAQLSKPAPIEPAGAASDRARRPSSRDTADLLSAPPEPVASVVLHAPTAIPDMVALTLSDAKQNDKLISAIDRAFDAPIREVSLQRPVTTTTIEPSLDASRLHSLTPSSVLSGIVPEPIALLRDLAKLRSESSKLHTISFAPVSPMKAIEEWSSDVEARLRRIVFTQGLQHPGSQEELVELLALTGQAHVLSANLEDNVHASQLGSVAYAVERRVRVWQAIAACVQSGGLSSTGGFTADQVARERLNELAIQIDRQLQDKPDGAGWRSFLQLDELIAWSASSDGNWQRGNELATVLLTRLNWERLTAAQRQFLTSPTFDALSAHLAPWAMQPVDYRQLLSDLEQLEDDPINRCRVSLAHTVQTLRVSPQPQQRAVAEAINDHYRNANIRLAVSGKLLERMMPNETFQARPVRQRILGADTQGNSQVRTNLKVQLIPDPTAWHLELGVSGDMESATQSSKGPAVFHQTSVAKINSSRTLRMDPNGIKVSADPTDVDASQYLNGMSTDLDRLPVVGDFFRAMVRQQFEQQRGLAQRITRRLIAEETDAELDKQLNQKLANAETQLKHTFIGPLERLGLNPIVVAMNTTPERLTIRYRVASEGQMAAHTARPRAPGDALVSMQIHQSAINNALGQLGLSDKTWTLPELCEKLADAFDQSPWVLPEDAPRDVSVRFAQTRPITVELRNGMLELTLRIAELNHPERKMSFQRFIIRANYVPVANGLEASLVRDGVVSVDGPRLGFGEKVPLRGIFGTVFAARSSLSLIHSQWLEDPRAAGLAVSQVEVRDGWLSVAVSDAASPHAAKTAAKAIVMEEATQPPAEIVR
ncbi:MAG: hypothetical protein IT423_14985 [Pirellulaceae bacterium]|nr:hypothetical protein [Pirellulaceae bacterium]